MQDKLFLKRDKQKKPAWNLSKLVFFKEVNSNYRAYLRNPSGV